MSRAIAMAKRKHKRWPRRVRVWCWLALLALAIPAAGVEIADLLIPRPGDTPRLTAAKQLLQQNPDNENALFGLAHASYQVARYADAVRAYDRMKEVRISRPHYVISDQAVALMRLGRNAEAEAGFREAMRLAPEFPHPYFGLALLWIRAGTNYQQAIDHLNTAIKCETDNGLKLCYQTHIGEAYLGLGDPARAIQELQAVKAALPVDLVGQNYPIEDVEAVYEVRFLLARAFARQANAAAVERELDEVLAAHSARRKLPPRGRMMSMPPGNFELTESPELLRELFLRWRMP